MKKKIIYLCIFLVFIVVSNDFVLFYVTFFEGGFFKKYNYETYDGKFLFLTTPYKATDVHYLELCYNEFTTYKPEYKNKKIYRTFSKNPLKYWHWHEYLFHKRYKYDYKKQSKICIPFRQEINRIQKLKRIKLSLKFKEHLKKKKAKKHLNQFN